MTNSESKRKLDESLALLNSLFAHPSKKPSTDTTTTTVTIIKDAQSGISPSTSALSARHHASLKKRVLLPPRPAVLDKLSRLSASRPTLQDSIAASIAASAPTARSSALSKSAASATSTTALEQTPQPPLVKRAGSTVSDKMRYLPWSRDQFHDRLETFKPSTWFDKPKLVNPIECAKRGWINKGDDRLECCGGCGGVVIVRIDQIEDNPSSSPSTDSNSTQDAAATENTTDTTTNDLDLDDTLPDLDVEALGPKFHAMLSSNHVTGCPWKSHPCDDSIYKFPVLTQSHARQEFLDRVKQLERMKSDSLTENIRHPLTADQVEKLSGMFEGDAETKLLILSLFGWSAAEALKVLVCKACHTRCTHIPSFEFRKTHLQDGSIEVDDGDDVTVGEEAEDEASFDTIQAHKWYCYWVDPEHNEKQQVGWKILYSLLASESSGQVSRSRAQDNDQANPASTRASIEPSEAVAMVKRILRGQVALF